MLADRRSRHAVAHRVESQRYRAARTLEDSIGDGLQAARNPEAAQPLREVHPGQPGVIGGAEQLGNRDGFRVVVGHDLSGEIGDAIRIENGAHQATIGNVSARAEIGGPMRGKTKGPWGLSRRCH